MFLNRKSVPFSDRPAHKAAWLLCLTATSASAFGNSTSAGPYTIDWHTEPATIAVGKAKLMAIVRDHKGNRLAPTSFKVLAQMPGMPMGEHEQTAVADSQTGQLVAPISFAMEGNYDLVFKVDGDQGSAQAKASIQTGETIHPNDTEDRSGSGFPSGFNSSPIILWSCAGVMLLGIVIVLQRKRKIISGAVLISLLVLGACVGGARWAVNNLRRPGSMTPLEVQSMAMDALPPEGVIPVSLAPVHFGKAEETVTYSGQAVGFNDQDIYPRVTGSIVSMPYYVGDVIHRGQVVARLDRSQLTPMTAQQRSALQASEMGVVSSAADYRAAAAMVVEASSEEGQYKAAIDEAEATLQAAKENLAAQNAMAASAEADVRDAEAQQASAQADRDFAVADQERAQKLLEAGAISKSEFQRKDTDARKMIEGVNAMRSNVRSLEAKALASKAQARASNAAVEAAQHKLEQAKNEMHVHMAHVTTARATAESAKSKIGQAEANAKQAAFALAAATANEGFATITSPIDGVVTARLVAPGTLVQPGTSILKISQISPIRVQANVAAHDLSRMHKGAEVRVISDGHIVAHARLTSVSPSVEYGSRTGTVEAILPNSNRTLNPGAFLTLEIGISDLGNLSLVPVEAIQYGPQEAQFVWIATPIPSTKTYSIRKVAVSLKGRRGGIASVVGNLKPQELVVTSGFGDLVDGATVSASAGVSQMETGNGQ